MVLPQPSKEPSGSCVVSTFARESLLGHNTSKTQFLKHRFRNAVSAAERRRALPARTCSDTLPWCQAQRAALVETHSSSGIFTHRLCSILQVTGKPMEGDVALLQEALLIAWRWCQVARDRPGGWYLCLSVICIIAHRIHGRILRQIKESDLIPDSQVAWNRQKCTDLS